MKKMKFFHKVRGGGFSIPLTAGILRKGVFLVIALVGCFACAYAQNCAALPIFNTSFTNQNLNVATTYTNQNIRITGTVNFNANVTMVRCTVLLDPGAILNIGNNATFRVEADLAGNRSVLFGCGTMWNSININQGCALILRNSIIRDGRKGLVFRNGFNNAISEIVGNIFTKNSVAITATDVTNFTFSAFSTNSFAGRQTLSQLLPPHAATDAMNALRLNNVQGVIGSAGARNGFFAFSTAIRARNSTLTVNNCYFSGNTLVDQFGAASSGIGIWVSGSDLTLQNVFSNNASCSFNFNRRGIRSDSTRRLIVKNAVFTNHLNLDIDVANSVFPYNLEIINNRDTLSNPTIGGYSIQRCAQGGGIHTRVQSNIMVLQPIVALANNIRFMFFPIPVGLAADQAVIANNQIFCSYGNGPAGSIARSIDGIWVVGNANGYQVSGNTINYVNPTGPPNAQVVSTAIAMTQVQGINNIVGPNNTITSTRFPNQVTTRDAWLRCGVHIDASNTAVCKNDVDDTRHGYHFQFNCANVEFGRNKARDATFGLEVWGPIPNNHNHRLNQWLGVYPAFGAAADNTAPPPPPFTWLVDATAANNPLGLMPPSFIPAGWFISQLNGGVSGTPICDAVAPPSGAFGEPPTKDLVHQYLNGGYGGLSTPAANWDFERTLLAQMMRFPATYTGTTEAEQYYNGKVNTSVWKVARADWMLDEAFAINSSDQAALDQLQTAKQVMTDSLGKLEIKEGADTTTTDAAWQAAKSSLLAQISTKQADVQALNAQIRSQHLNNLNSVRTYIGSLPESDELEADLKTVLYLQAKQYAGESWPASDLVMLRSVATSCPETVGEVVTTAREMLPAEEALTFGREGFDSNCKPPLQGGASDRGSWATAADKGISIWPNPANDLLSVGFKQAFTGMLEIVDPAGTVVHSLRLEQANKANIPLQGWPKGVYFARFSTPGQPVATQRFVVAH